MVRFFVAGLCAGFPLGCYLREKGTHKRIQAAYRVLKPGEPSKCHLSVEKFSNSEQHPNRTSLETRPTSSTKSCRLAERSTRTLKSTFTANTAQSQCTKTTKMQLKNGTTWRRKELSSSFQRMSREKRRSPPVGSELDTSSGKTNQLFIEVTHREII